LGLSCGVKGARIGAGPRGTYVHAGREGLYYRKNLSSGRSGSSSKAGGEGCAKLLLVLIAIGIGAWLFQWIAENPAVLVLGSIVAASILFLRWWVHRYRKNCLSAYKQALDAAFVVAEPPPTAANLAILRQQQQGLPKDNATTREIQNIETDVYQAVLDRILDDEFITEEESASIAAAEQLLNLSPEIRLQTKKEIFSAAYVEAIEDREITKAELSRLMNLVAGLAIPESELQRELDIVREILNTQALRLPFAPIPKSKLTVQTQKSEDAFYQCPAKVLSKRKSKNSPTGYEYTVRREGTMVLTDKRIFIVGDGTTNIRYGEIDDLDVDIDEGVVEISKVGSGRPIILKAGAPIYIGRAIDLLMNAHADEATA
jgi:hypothetical protein